MDFLRPFLSRALSPIVAGLAGLLAVKYGINLDADTQQQIVLAVVGLVAPLMLVVNGIVHKVLDKHFNPGDAASSHLAASEKHEAVRIKARGRVT